MDNKTRRKSIFADRLGTTLDFGPTDVSRVPENLKLPVAVAVITDVLAWPQFLTWNLLRRTFTKQLEVGSCRYFRCERILKLDI